MQLSAARPGGSGKAALSSRSASSSASPGAGATLYEKACVHPRLRRPLPVAKPSIDRPPAASQVAAPSPHHQQREDSHPAVIGCRVRASRPPRRGTDLLRGMVSLPMYPSRVHLARSWRNFFPVVTYSGNTPPSAGWHSHHYLYIVI